MKKLLLSLVASSLLMSTAVQAGATASNPARFDAAYQVKVLFLADDTVKNNDPFFYGPEYGNRYDGARTKFMDAHISDLNSIFYDSRVNLKAVKVGYEYLGGKKFAEFLHYTQDGDVNRLKQQYGADVVYLFSTQTLGSGCGRATIGSGFALGRLTTGNCITTHTFNHQMGHMLGVYDYGDTNAKPFYAQGYKIKDTWNDIMATETGAGGLIIKRNFSNPDIACDAFNNCGDSHHNAVRAINESVPKRFSKIQ